MPVHIQVVKFVPNPYWIPVGIEVDYDVSKNLCRRSLASQDDTFEQVAKDEKMSIRERRYVVMKAEQRQIIIRCAEFLVELCNGKLPDYDTCQIDFLDRLESR